MDNKTAFGLILGGLCLVWFVWALFAWGGNTRFDRSISEDTIKALLASRDLNICGASQLKLDATPGLVQGKALTLSRHCMVDPNPLHISLLEFESEEARNAAQQRIASTHRNGFGPHFAYTYGPYVITVQGTRGLGDQILLGEALSRISTNP